jgi:hypothetical protein
MSIETITEALVAPLRLPRLPLPPVKRYHVTT